MKTTILFLLTFLLSSVIVFGQKVPLPQNYTIVDTVFGDLDKDGIKELVAAYNTRKIDVDSYDSVTRELIIYKRENGNWIIWKKSSQALYGSRDGGMMGDPFEELVIDKGILEISQNGGSSWKWGHTDKYRYQNDEFRLIGYTSNAGKPCEDWETVDFNLLTGKMIVEKAYEQCDEQDDNPNIYRQENETMYVKGLKITLQNRSTKEVKIVTPKYKHEIYVATKR